MTSLWWVSSIFLYVGCVDSKVFQPQVQIHEFLPNCFLLCCTPACITFLPTYSLSFLSTYRNQRSFLLQPTILFIFYIQ